MDDRIADKIRKLLALGTSANEHEAAAAMAAAQRLCEEHRLSLAEVEAAGREQAEAARVDETPVARAGRLESWERVLLAALADANGCIAFRGRTLEKGDKGGWRLVQNMFLAGRPDDVEMARHLYAFAHLELVRLWKRDSWSFGAAGRRSWMTGAVHAIQRKLERANTEARSSASTTAITLVDSRVDAASKALHEAAGKIHKDKASTRKLDYYAYVRGHRAGSRIDLAEQDKLGVGNATGNM